MHIFQGEIYCAAVFMQLILGWNVYSSVCIILAVVAVYTIIGTSREWNWGGCEIDLNLNLNAHWLIHVEVEVVSKM